MLLCSFMIFIISFSKMSKDASLLYHYSNLNKSQSKNLPWSKINQKANYLISLLKVNKIPLAHHDPNDLELPRLGILKLINTGSRRITLNKQICCLYHYLYIYTPLSLAFWECELCVAISSIKERLSIYFKIYISHFLKIIIEAEYSNFQLSRHFWWKQFIMR